VYDLSGNVWEWEDSCNNYAGSGDYCRLRGGSCNYYDEYLRCAYGDSDTRALDYSAYVGFRCCAP
jgi:formylglycine-generating enzyme required for sulfatase activity